MPNWYNLLTGEGIAGYMSESKSTRDWDQRARTVRRANLNQFPTGWYSHVISTNLAAKVAKGWADAKTYSSFS